MATVQQNAKKAFQRSDVEKLRKMILLLLAKPEFVALLYSVVDQADYDRFVRALVTVSIASGCTVPLLRSVMQAEFSKGKSTPQSIMRGSNAASKIMGVYCRQSGAKYLQKMLGNLLMRICEDTELDLEIDPIKLPENVDKNAVVEANTKKLLDQVDMFLKRITSKEMLKLMPRDIRALAYFTQQCALEHVPEMSNALIGGFLMLRFINPALITPESYGLLPHIRPSPKARRNLTLITKVLQALSNKMEFAEDCFKVLNPYILSNTGVLENYYKEVCTDSECPEGSVPFSDFVQSRPREFNSNSVDCQHYEFFHNIFAFRKERLTEGLSQMPSDIRASDLFMEFFDAVSEYEEPTEETPQAANQQDTPEDASADQKQSSGSLVSSKCKLELFYSPLCPFSRLVWLFCLECKIECDFVKIDLLKKDQELDLNYKRFKNVSKSLQVPLLIDDGFYLEESHAIVYYLLEKYFLAVQWNHPNNLCNWSLVMQAMDWLCCNLHHTIGIIWEAVKSLTTDSRNLEKERFLELFDSLSKLDKMIKPRTNFYLGAKACIADVAIALYVSMCQLIQGFTLTRYPNLIRVVDAVHKAFEENWKKVNSEFEGFARYVATISKRDSLPRVTQMVIFNQAPTTMYEMVLDPENDIFMLLASKTISVKTNAKVKKGLKRLGEKNELGEGGEKAQPYEVSLETGGKFNINGREGTNLLLVPGDKICQVSRRGDWPAGQHSTELFEFHPVHGKARLIFTQMNCPIAKLKESEEQWERFFSKKLNGLLVADIKQTVYFKGKKSIDIFPLLSDLNKMAKVLKTRIKIEDDGTATLLGKTVILKVTESESNKKVLMTFRMADWTEDHNSQTTHILSDYEGGCRVAVTIADVPLDKTKTSESTWKNQIWKKLGGVLCEDITQTVKFRTGAEDVYKMWLSSDALSKALKSRCTVEDKINGNISFAEKGIKGVILEKTPPKKIVMSYTHKDWPSMHTSIVKLNIEPTRDATTIFVEHENIPVKYIRSIAETWTTEFWDKMEGTLIDEIHSSLVLPLPRNEVYPIFLDSERLSTITQTECVIKDSLGSDFSMYDKFIKGKILDLVENHLIVLSWRGFDWPFKHFSEVKYQFEEVDGGAHTLVQFEQIHVPVAKLKQAHDSWEKFCKDIKTFLVEKAERAAAR